MHSVFRTIRQLIIATLYQMGKVRNIIGVLAVVTGLSSVGLRLVQISFFPFHQASQEAGGNVVASFVRPDSLAQWLPGLLDSQLTANRHLTEEQRGSLRTLLHRGTSLTTLLSGGAQTVRRTQARGGTTLDVLTKCLGIIAIMLGGIGWFYGEKARVVTGSLTAGGLGIAAGSIFTILAVWLCLIVCSLVVDHFTREHIEQ